MNKIFSLLKKPGSVLKEKIGGSFRNSILLYLLRDLNEHLGLIAFPLKFIVYVILSVPGLILARNLHDFDVLIKKRGLPKAADWLLEKYGFGKELKGLPLPDSGPVLVVCNHPGLFDGTVLISLIQRKDVKIVASESAFYAALPNLRKYLIMVNPHPAMRIQATISMLKTLKEGKMLILFGRGIDDEPDPKFTDSAHDILRMWLPAAGTLVLSAQEEGFQFSILPVLISNVFTERARRNPLVRRIPDELTRDRVARIHVTLRGGEKGQKVTVNVGEPLDSAWLAEMSKDPKKLTEAVRNRLRELRQLKSNEL